MRLLSYHDLKPQKGIQGTKVTLWRRERERRFPRRDHMGRFPFWPEPVIDAFVAALIAGHNEEQATKIAERVRNNEAAP